MFAKDPLFVSRLDESNDFKLPADDEWTATKAKTIIKELSGRPVSGTRTYTQVGYN